LCSDATAAPFLICSQHEWLKAQAKAATMRVLALLPFVAQPVIIEAKIGKTIARPSHHLAERTQKKMTQIVPDKAGLLPE